MTEPENLPTSQLLSRLSEQTSALVRQELRLAQLELQEKGRHAGIGAGLLGVAGAAALLGRRQVGEATPPVPEQALQSTKTDLDTVKEAAHR